MKEAYNDIPLINNEVMRQLEIKVDGRKAFIEYEHREGKMYLTHAEVPEEMRNRGIGEALAEKAMVYLEKNNIALVPMCSFIKHYLREHQEWQKLLATGIRLQ